MRLFLCVIYCIVLISIVCFVSSYQRFDKIKVKECKEEGEKEKGENIRKTNRVLSMTGGYGEATPVNLAAAYTA